MAFASGIGRALRYIRDMAYVTSHFKCIAAAFALAVGFSLPVVADEARVDDLLNQLREAEGIQAARIAVEIQNEWSKSGSAAFDLLLRRGEEALEEGNHLAAIEHLTAAIDHAPEYLEAYAHRAEAYYLNDDIGPAIDDLAYVLARNPRHFSAMQGFGVILYEMGRTQDALEVLRQVLEMYPADEVSQQWVTALEIELEGRAL